MGEAEFRHHEHRHPPVPSSLNQRLKHAPSRVTAASWSRLFGLGRSSTTAVVGRHGLVSLGKLAHEKSGRAEIPLAVLCQVSLVSAGPVLSATSCVLWGVADGACLVWALANAHAVSDHRSQSACGPCRLLLPSASTSRTASSLLDSERLHQSCSQFARVHRRPFRQRHAGPAELHAPATVTARRQQSSNHRIISRRAPIVRRGVLAAALACFTSHRCPRLQRLKQANRLGSRSAPVNWAWHARGSQPAAKPFQMRMLLRGAW